MSKFVTAVRSFVSDEEGVTALEYGMIAALIAAVIVMSVGEVGTGVKGAFDKIVAVL